MFKKFSRKHLKYMSWLVLGIALCLPRQSSAINGVIDILAEFNVQYVRGSNPVEKQIWKITYQDVLNFSGTTYTESGAPLGTISGTLSGSVFNATSTFTDGSGVVMTFDGLFANNNLVGTFVSGHWAKNDGYSGTPGTYVAIRSTQLHVKGKVAHENQGVAGVTLTIKGTADNGDAVSATTTSAKDGSYSFNVNPGTYNVTAFGEADYDDNGVTKKENGGVISAEDAGGADCDGNGIKNICYVNKVTNADRIATFNYTPCAAEELKPNGKPLTHCPVILVPGFLGSRINCQAQELWPGLPLPGWHVMQLQADGISNKQDNGDCNAVAQPGQGEAGVVDAVAGGDIYKGAIDFLKKEYPGRWRASPYDWRKSPVLGAELLEGQVNDILLITKAKHVVLYGHSMGGLVIREYLNKTENANKVARIVTAGTPYWGAPKSHFALLGGYTETPGGGVLDYITIAGDLQLLARNLQGLFFLYPSLNLKPWLSVSPSPGKPALAQGPAGEDEWVASLGATPALLDNARNWHAQNDGFPQTAIDYRVVVGSGTATTLQTKVFVQTDPNILDPGRLDAFGHITVGDGDGTVPIRSATQGFSDGGTPPVPIYYACNVGHVALPVNKTVLDGIRPFLAAGEDVVGMQTKCPIAGNQLLMYDLDIGAGNQVTVNPDGFQSAQLSTRAAQSNTMGLDEAVKQGLVQYNVIGRTTIILTDDAKPVTITIDGKAVAFQTQKFGSNGPGELLSFKPVKGPVVIDTTGQALSTKGSKLQPIKGGGKAPKTTAVLTKKGSNVTVKLTAKGATGVGGTYYQIGSGVRQIYKKPFKVKAGKKPVKISFFSVDPFGVAEKAKKATVGK